MNKRSVARHGLELQGMERRNIVLSGKPAGTSSAWAILLEHAMRETLAVTCWFTPPPYARPYSVTIRFAGRRLGVKGRLSASDRFVHDETIEEVIPGSGPISVTARVGDIHPGAWVVTAHILSSTPGSPSQVSSDMLRPARQGGPIMRFWRRWAPSAEAASPLHTCLLPSCGCLERSPASGGEWSCLVWRLRC